MKSIVVKILLIIVLFMMTVTLSGCTLKIETTDKSVSASVDEETTEKVGSVIDWIKEKLSGIFVFEDTENTETDQIGDGKGTIM